MDGATLCRVEERQLRFGTAEDLVFTLAAPLWETAQQWVPRVLGGERAPHPLDVFIRAQEAPSSADYQLPVPLLGPVRVSPTVLVIGENPGYDPGNASDPRLGASLPEFVAWVHAYCTSRYDRGRIVKRVNGKPTVIPHYRWVEDVLAPALGSRALGAEAVYADAIPWKWPRRPRTEPGRLPAPRPDLRDSAVTAYARGRLHELVDGLRPRLVLSLGDAAGRFLMALPARWPEQELTVYPLRRGGWECQHLPILHPANRTGRVTADYVRAVGERISQALASR